MRAEYRLPEKWFSRHAEPFIVEAAEGAPRKRWIEKRLGEARQVGARTWLLPCDFDQGGPWAGVRELFGELVAAGAGADLMRRHDYELVHVLPELRASLTVRNESLTDTAPDMEKVRNYPADRALRMMHGLIDLLAEWKSGDEQPWVVACDGFDRISPSGGFFFRELVRRRGVRLQITLLVLVRPRTDIHHDAAWGGLSGMRIRPKLAAPSAEIVDRQAWRTRARELEERVAGTPDALLASLPDLIAAWRSAGDEERLLRFRVHALAIYPVVGLYDEAVRYSRGLGEAVLRAAPDDHDLHWLVFFKTFVSLTAVGRAEEALQLANEAVLPALESVPPARRAQLFYLIAMLHVRYLKTRDLALGEGYLERGLQEIRNLLPAEERHFQYVFNRNGFAFILTLQHRYAEALAICRDGLDRLERHLKGDQHRLHRSVLLYNMAQVCATTGDHAQAIERYSAAIQMDPKYSEYYNERANLFLRLGRLEEALADYLLAIEYSPPYAEVWTNLGQCYNKMGAARQAVEAYSRSLDLNPDGALALLGRAQAHEALDSRDEAILDYGRALALAPEQWEAFANRAVLHFEAGDPDAALADLDCAVSLAPGEAGLHQNRALALIELGRTGEAEKALQEYLRLNPDAPDRDTVSSRLRSLAL